jgi:hypothetical protein
LSRVFEVYNNDAACVDISGLTVRDGECLLQRWHPQRRGSTLTMSDCVIGPNNIDLWRRQATSWRCDSESLHRCATTDRDRRQEFASIWDITSQFHRQRQRDQQLRRWILLWDGGSATWSTAPLGNTANNDTAPRLGGGVGFTSRTAY